MSTKAQKNKLDKAQSGSKLSLKSESGTKGGQNTKDKEGKSKKAKKGKGKITEKVPEEPVPPEPVIDEDPNDENRPTKLAERLGEIYQTEWANTWDKMREYNIEETKILKFLAAILRRGYDFSLNWSRHQLDHLYSEGETLKTIITGPNYAFRGNERTQVLEYLNNETRTYLQDYRKKLCMFTLPFLKESYVAEVKSKLNQTLPEVPLSCIQPFVKKVIEVTWFMCISDPPVFFCWLDENPPPLPEPSTEIEVEKPGVSILDYFENYNDVGEQTEVDFTVWPAMLLKEAGPLLRKGVLFVRSPSEKEQSMDSPDTPVPLNFNFRDVGQTSRILRPL